MTNLDRLKLELANRQYYTDSEYTVFLDEEGLAATAAYDKKTDYQPLLLTVIDILDTLQNNIDNLMKIQTEFTTRTQAYEFLKDRIDQINRKIATLPTYDGNDNQISFLYHD